MTYFSRSKWSAPVPLLQGRDSTDRRVVTVRLRGGFIERLGQPSSHTYGRRWFAFLFDTSLEVFHLAQPEGSIGMPSIPVAVLRRSLVGPSQNMFGLIAHPRCIDSWSCLEIVDFHISLYTFTYRLSGRIEE